MAFNKDELKQLKQMFQTFRNDIVDTLIKYVDKKVDDAVKPLATKADVNHLPTKDEFYKRMDKLAGEYKNFSTDAPNLTKQVSDHEDRLGNIESHLGITANA